MSFQSVEYLIFLVIAFLLYWIVCSRDRCMQNGLLVAANLLFYGWWDWRFLGLMLMTALSTFLAGRWIEESECERCRRWISAGTIVLNVGVLFVFKYYNFFVESLTDLINEIGGIGIGLSTLDIILPVGISFYTFTALSYSIDVYRRKIAATDDYLAYFAYVSFFPAILSGPISNAQKQLPQYLMPRTFSRERAVEGCKMFLYGALLKLCLADRLGIYVDTVYSNIGFRNGSTLLLTSVFYSLQIYGDFAGYSLMAVGSGKLFGIELPTNFIRPYLALSVTDFWRRWHISLTSWFRDYVYFPLGGNRCGRTRWMMNVMVVFLVSGLWHGAAYNFLLWGGIHGAIMVLERLVYGDRLKSIPHKFSLFNVCRWMLTFTLVNLLWVVFRVGDIHDLYIFFHHAITTWGTPFPDLETFLTGSLAIGIVVFHDLNEELGWNVRLLSSRNAMIRYLTAILLVVYILSYGILNSNSFIYFQF